VHCTYAELAAANPEAAAFTFSFATASAHARIPLRLVSLLVIASGLVAL